MRPPHRAERPWFQRPGTLAVGLSLLAHGVLLGLAFSLSGRTSAPSSRMHEIAACLLDDEAPTESEPHGEEPAEERSDVFRFAETRPEPAGSIEDTGPNPLTTADGDPRPGGVNSTGEGGSVSQRRATGLFHANDRARTVVYVIDRSLSMGLRGSLEAAKRELLASLERLPPDARFQVLFYNRQTRPLMIAGRNGLLPTGEAVRREAATAVAEVGAEGSTNHIAALREALALGPEVIYLVTDADDLSVADVREITRINRGRTAIHTVDLGATRLATDGALRALAEANRGTYRAVDLAELR